MLRLTPNLYILIVAIIAGLISTRKDDLLYRRLFPYFLLLTLFVEFTGQLLKKPGQPNALIFNIYSIVELLFYAFFFYQEISDKKIRKYIKISSTVITISSLVNIFAFQGTHVFHTYTYSIGCLQMITLGAIYFYFIFKQETKVNLLRSPAFWISAGIIFFFTSSVTLITSFNYVATLPAKFRRLTQQMLFMVNALFYLLFTIAFLCKTQIRKSSPNI